TDGSKTVTLPVSRIDLAQIVAGERGEEHSPTGVVAMRRGRAAWRVEHSHRARLGIESAVDTGLPGEPQHALAIQGALRPGERTRQHLRFRGVGRALRFLPHPAGETCHTARIKAESTTSIQNWTNPNRYSGIRA